MARIRRDGPSWPSWRYGPNGESEVFQCEADVPLGWTPKPGDIYIPRESGGTLDRDELAAQLLFKGIWVSPIWSTAYMKELVDND